MKKQIWMGLFASLGVLFLIFDAPTALSGAREAVELCMNVVIPSLFPFFVLINLLCSAMVGSLSRRLQPLERFLKIPAGSGGIFLSGLLGGYPTGAQLVHQSWHDGILNRQDANRMLAFCSNAGPAFLFGIVAGQFSQMTTVWVIWGVHILSSVAVARLLPVASCSKVTDFKAATLSVSDALRRAVTVIAYVCGWIILFRVISAFCTRWFFWLFPSEVQVVFVSFFELANGCVNLASIKNDGLRMIIATAAVNYGGLCVLMQTASVTRGLLLRSYIKGKLLQTCVGVCLSVPLQFLLFPREQRLNIEPIVLYIFIAMLPILWFLTQKRKITVAFR